MASGSRELIERVGLIGPALSFKRALVSRRDGRPSGAPKWPSAEPRQTRVGAVLRLAGGGAGYLLRVPESLRYFARGYRYAQEAPAPILDREALPPQTPSTLEAYFDAHTEGLTLLKRRHYFRIYERHLGRFRGGPLTLVEIGVSGGGSLEMWRDYLGPQIHIYGIDRDPACKMRAGEGIEIVLGDQADRRFWTRFLESSSPIDIVLDDGGHKADQQAVALECLLPHIRPGGVYICEDIGGSFQAFHSFVDGLTRPLSAIARPQQHHTVNPLQMQIASVHRYPMMTVIEKPSGPVDFIAQRRPVADTALAPEQLA